MAETSRTQGFKAGIRYERDRILDFIATHLDQGVLITLEDIVADLNYQDKQDMDNHLRGMGL